MFLRGRLFHWRRKLLSLYCSQTVAPKWLIFQVKQTFESSSVMSWIINHWEAPAITNAQFLSEPLIFPLPVGAFDDATLRRRTPQLRTVLYFKSTVAGRSSTASMYLAVSLESYQPSENSQLPFTDYFQNRDAKRFISLARRCSTFTDVATSVRVYIFFFLPNPIEKKMHMYAKLWSFVPGRHDCTHIHFPTKHKKRMQVEFPSLGCWLAAHIHPLDRKVWVNVIKMPLKGPLGCTHG